MVKQQPSVAHRITHLQAARELHLRLPLRSGARAHGVAIEANGPLGNDVQLCICGFPLAEKFRAGMEEHGAAAGGQPGQVFVGHAPEDLHPLQKHQLLQHREGRVLAPAGAARRRAIDDSRLRGEHLGLLAPAVLLVFAVLVAGVPRGVLVGRLRLLRQPVLPREEDELRRHLRAPRCVVVASGRRCRAALGEKCVHVGGLLCVVGGFLSSAHE
mmetsp:Transcript_97752/g.301366  ORF Transcript_97752/g.301366 Transcript_97752/m.301366 type:complete len:214 (-) Transcript_97752:790-1431(-)